MSKRRPGRFLLQDIIECAEKIWRYTDGMTFEDFINDGMTVDAVVRNFEIICEAVNQLPQNIKDNYPTVDWFKIRGFRNRIIHDYVNIDYETVWEIRDSFLRGTVEEVKRILNELPE